MIQLPSLVDPPRYAGLYVYDAGEWCAVGYTADEIAVLLESPAHAGGKIYKIRRAWPDGRMELAGVSPTRFQLESGMFFRRSELAPAREDFDALAAEAERTPPPCRAVLRLAEQDVPGARFVTGLIYPAEYEDEMGSWLCAIDYRGGDTVEGGISQVVRHQEDERRLIERRQLWPSQAIRSRSAQEVLASVRRAVQR